MARAFALFLVTVLTACAPSPDGSTQEKTSVPRIVSLNPCTDAILVEVADPGQILALSHYSRDPAASSMDTRLAARWPATRGTAEEVLALQPDLVLASTYLDPATAAAFARLGLSVEQVGVAASVAESRAQVRRIARLAGHPERGDALVARINAALAAAAPSSAKPLATVVWQQDGRVPGPETLIVDLLRHTGLVNAAAERGLGQSDMLGLEAVLADPPELLLQVVSGARSGQADRKLMEHPALTRLQRTTVAAFDPRLNFCGGPSIIPAVQRLAEVREQALRQGRGT